jgi:hypothetical protein
MHGSRGLLLGSDDEVSGLDVAVVRVGCGP